MGFEPQWMPWAYDRDGGPPVGLADRDSAELGDQLGELLAPVAGTDSLESSIAWLRCLPDTEMIVINYLVTPVDVAGTKGLGKGFSQTIRRPALAVRPALAELRVRQEFPEQAELESADVDAKIYLALTDGAWEGDLQDQNYGGYLFNITRHYRLIVQKEEIEPSGHYGSDGATSRLRSPASLAAARQWDEEVFELDFGKSKPEAGGDPKKFEGGLLREEIEPDDETRGKIGRWARLSGLSKEIKNLDDKDRLPDALSPADQARLRETLRTRATDGRRTATRFSLETVVRITPSKPGKIAPAVFVSRRVNVPVEHVLVKASEDPSGRTTATLRPDALEWAEPLNLPPPGPGQLQAESGFARFRVPAKHGTLGALLSKTEPPVLIRDPERRILTTVRFAAVPTGIAHPPPGSPLAPGDETLVASYDLHELDLDSLASTADTNPWEFKAEDFADAAQFINKVGSKRRLLDRHLAALPGITPFLTGKFEIAKLALAIEALLGTRLYNEDRFKDIRLRGETRRLAGLAPGGMALQILNRMLLEDAFPKELRSPLLLENAPAWRQARCVGRIEQLTHGEANLTPDSNAELANWHAHYPSETQRLTRCSQASREPGSDRPIRSGWYSARETTAGFPERRPRLRFFPQIPEDAVTELMRKGSPSSLEFELSVRPESKAAKLIKEGWEIPIAELIAPGTGRPLHAKPASVKTEPIGNSHCPLKWITLLQPKGLSATIQDEILPLTPNDIRQALLETGFIAFGSKDEQVLPLQKWLSDPSALDGLELTIRGLAPKKLRGPDGELHDVENEHLVTGTITLALDLHSPIHPLLEELIGDLSYLHAPVSNILRQGYEVVQPPGVVSIEEPPTLYQGYEVMVQPPPPLQATNLEGFMANTPPAADPYGWGILQTLGLAAALRIFDKGTGQFLDPERLAKTVNTAFEKVLSRWRVHYPDLKGSFAGQPFVEVHLRPGRDREAGPFDAVLKDGIEQEKAAFDLNDDALSLIQVSLRPRPVSVWNYWTREIAWKKIAPEPVTATNLKFGSGPDQQRAADWELVKVTAETFEPVNLADNWTIDIEEARPVLRGIALRWASENRFKPEELLQPSGLLTKLLSGKDPASEDEVAKHLWPRLEAVLKDPAANEVEQAAKLLQALNQLVDEDNDTLATIYQPEPFKDVKTAGETKRLIETLAQDLESHRIARLNRLLLRDAYPEHFAFLDVRLSTLSVARLQGGAIPVYDDIRQEITLSLPLENRSLQAVDAEGRIKPAADLKLVARIPASANPGESSGLGRARCILTWESRMERSKVIRIQDADGKEIEGPFVIRRVPATLGRPAPPPENEDGMSQIEFRNAWKPVSKPLRSTPDPFDRFDEWKPVDWAAAFGGEWEKGNRPTQVMPIAGARNSYDAFRHSLIAAAPQVAAPDLAKTPLDFPPMAGAYGLWLQRFLDHAAGTLWSFKMPALALAAPMKALPWKLAPDSSDQLSLSFLHSDRWCHCRAYAVKPVSRYHHLLAGLRIKDQEDADKLVPSGNVSRMPGLGCALAVSPRTEKLETPVILGSRIVAPSHGEPHGEHDLIEIVVARHGEEALASSNRTLFARLGTPTSLTTFARVYRHPEWLVRLKALFEADGLVPEPLLKVDPITPIRPGGEPRISGRAIAEVVNRYPQIWKGAQIWRIAPIPPHYQFAAFAAERAGVVVSKVAASLQDNLPRRPLAKRGDSLMPKDGPPEFDASIRIVAVDGKPRLELRHPLVSHSDLTPESAHDWFDSTNANDIAWWPDPEVAYVLQRVSRVEGTTVVEEDLDLRLTSEGKAAFMARARGTRYVNEETPRAHLYRPEGAHPPTPPIYFHLSTLLELRDANEIEKAKLSPGEILLKLHNGNEIEKVKLASGEWETLAKAQRFNETAAFAAITHLHWLRLEGPVATGRTIKAWLDDLEAIVKALQLAASSYQPFHPWENLNEFNTLTLELDGLLKWVSDSRASMTETDPADDLPAKAKLPLHVPAHHAPGLPYPDLGTAVEWIPDDPARTDNPKPSPPERPVDRDCYLTVWAIATDDTMTEIEKDSYPKLAQRGQRLARMLTRRLMSSATSFRLRVIDTRAEFDPKAATPEDATPGIFERDVTLPNWMNAVLKPIP